MLGLNVLVNRTSISKSATPPKGGNLLPVDIVYDIIDEVQDKPTLAACSLVNRVWMQVSRDRLFRAVDIKGGSHDGDGCVRRFLHALQEQEKTSSTPISRHIRQLTFKGNLGLFNRNGDGTPLSLGLLCTLLNRVPQVTSLAFHEIQITDDFPPTKDGIKFLSRDAWSQRPMHSLVITGLVTTLETPLVLTSLVSLFNKIHFLGLFLPIEPKNAPRSVLESSRTVEVRSLSVICLPSTVATPFYDLLHGSGTFDGVLKNASLTLLEGLEMAYPPQAAYETPMRVLRQAGPHLRVLELRLTSDFLTSRVQGRPNHTRNLPSKDAHHFTFYFSCL